MSIITSFRDALIAFTSVLIEMNGSGYASDRAHRIYDQLVSHERGPYEALKEIAKSEGVVS